MVVFNDDELKFIGTVLANIKFRIGDETNYKNATSVAKKITNHFQAQKAKNNMPNKKKK